MSEIVAVIPARKGSQRIKNKNTRKFKGVSLVGLSIRCALRCPLIDRIVVSTNDQVVRDIAFGHGVECFHRSSHLAGDTSRTFDVLVDVLEKLKTVPEFLVLLQPTSPLREIDLIEKGLKLIKDDSGASSLISVHEHRVFTGRIENGYWFADYPEETRSQDIPPKYIPAGSLYI